MEGIEIIKKETIELDELTEKFDTLIDLTKIVISLLKISNQQFLFELMNRINNDKILSKIFEHSNGTNSYGELVARVSDETGNAKITIKKKITELRNLGVINTMRKYGEIVYVKTGII